MHLSGRDEGKPDRAIDIIFSFRADVAVDSVRPRPFVRRSRSAATTSLLLLLQIIYECGFLTNQLRLRRRGGEEEGEPPKRGVHETGWGSQ